MTDSCSTPLLPSSKAVPEAGKRLCRLCSQRVRGLSPLPPPHPPQVQLAKRLVQNSFADKAFFCNSGTEANEGAIKFARKFARVSSFE